MIRLPVNYQIAATYLSSKLKQTIVAVLGVTCTFHDDQLFFFRLHKLEY